VKGAVRLAAALLAGVLLMGCADARRYDQAICALIDVSGTYADQKTEAVRILKRDVLPEMVPGDTLLVIQIGSESYTKKNLVALVTLDPRPSQANAQKLALAQRLDAFASGADTSQYTDIVGAMMLGADYLRELQSGSRVMLVFSDMDQDLPKGMRRRIHSEEFKGLQVVAMNVKRLGTDNADPDAYRGRLTHWQQTVRRAGATGWRAMMDPEQLPEYLASLR
jgi:hypothetical protein